MYLKVLLADDHEIVREGFRSLLTQQPDIEVVAVAADGQEAVRLCRELVPDVAVMDIGMPGLNGIEATRRITNDCPDTRVVALSIHSEGHYVGEMLKAGASGYLLKSCAFHELVQAIRAVADQQIYLSPKIASNALEEAAIETSRKKGATTASGLSGREKEVLQLLAEGKSSKEIASCLFLSVRTVDAHRKNIMDKLGLRSIAELTKYAIREGISFLETQP
jgi:DNA-binding NarL/FixJ family response regulator